ncbi:MAG TPA: hypothetical protein VGM73_04770 [Candidatus Didemnitutus sp.]|jgi:hypothetical protein
MKTLRLICSLLAIGAAATAFGADPTGTWKWATPSPNGDIDTTLKLESKDGKLAGAYSNQFGDTAISNVSLQDDVLEFDVVRNYNGNKFVVKYHGKLEGDTIKGTIEAPGHDGGGTVRLEWNAKRASKSG